MTTTTNLLISHIESSQAQKEVTANEAFSALDTAIAGRLAISTTGATTTLTDAQARNAILDISGALTSNAVINVPARSKLYAVRNATSGAFTLTVKTASGAGVTVGQGESAIVFCDGTNVGAANPSPRVISPELKNYTETTATNAASGTAATLDLALANVHDLTLTGNCTISFAGAPASGKSGSLTIFLRQDATGGWSVTWPASVKWPGGAAPTLTTSANALDELRLSTHDGGATWYGRAVALNLA